ncbi:MAG: Na/Pi cotransporter family protein [Spirochaetes bacterium]|nr:Na/Pi cotransporter family protein [Spirochaetota bacterium]
MAGLKIAITVLGGLGLFLFGMKVMSEALQKATGEKLRDILSKVTSNRFLGLLTGLGITALIQSSSATTVMLVSFVNAGLINLTQSVGIILGANIGTTVTGWIVALLGFKIQVTSFALPAVAIGFFIRFLKNEKFEEWGEVILGFGLLFLGLDIMNSAVKDLRGSEAVMNIMSMVRADTLPSAVLVVLIGSAVTMVVQSSSATVAMTMALAVNGLIDFYTCCALILGENIGTTITAFLASMGASTTARRAARVHMLFNVLGVIWVLACFHWFFVPLVNWIVPGDVFSPVAAERSKVIADHMAAFHTMFNVTNALVFLPFTGFLAKVATRLVPEKRGAVAAEEFHLKYIASPLLSTPAININQARLETRRMMGIAIEMFDMVMEVFGKPGEKLGVTVEDIQGRESTIDRLEKEISEYLVKISKDSISQDQSAEISMLLHAVNDCERIGDHCENLLKLVRRKYDGRLSFSDRAVEEIDEISLKVRELLMLIYDSLMRSPTGIMTTASVLENRINELRKELRTTHIERLNEGACDVPSGLVFIDMLTSFEKIGDHAFNIAEGIGLNKIT